MTQRSSTPDPAAPGAPAPPAALLTAAQDAVATRVLAEESRARRHLVVALSGAHAYGFPSPDSDLDLKAVHILPTEALLALTPPKPTHDRLEVVDGIEIDYTSNELAPALAGVLAGNGNFAERLLAEHALVADPVLAELRPIIARALSRRLHRHYRGFATGQLEAVLGGGPVPAKRVLYVLRTALTGAHVLRTGQLDPDLSHLASDYGFPEAHDLIAAKRAGERTVLSEADLARWRAELGRAFTRLDEALQRSILPEEAPNRAELEAWLIDLRRRSFSP